MTPPFFNKTSTTISTTTLIKIQSNFFLIVAKLSVYNFKPNPL